MPDVTYHRMMSLHWVDGDESIFYSTWLCVRESWLKEKPQCVTAKGCCLPDENYCTPGTLSVWFVCPYCFPSLFIVPSCWGEKGFSHIDCPSLPFPVCSLQLLANIIVLVLRCLAFGLEMHSHLVTCIQEIPNDPDDDNHMRSHNVVIACALEELVC